MLTQYKLRSARKTDEKIIKELIERVRINPMNIHWKYFIVAETLDGVFIGCGQLKHHNDGSIELASIAVEEAYRKQGVGRAIIEELLTDSPRPLYLMCRPVLGTFYEKFGFQTITGKELPPYFARIQRIIRAMNSFARQDGPLIMRLN